MYARILCAALCLGLWGCRPDPVVEVTAEPVEEILETAVGAAYAARQSLDAMESGQVSPCVQVAQGCTNVGCNFDVELDVGPECPMPMTTGSGVLVVAGVYSDADTAVIGATYTDLHVGDELWFVYEIATMVVTRGNDDTLTIAYAQQDVQTVSGVDVASARLAQHAWVVTEDPDGTLNVSGGVQDASAGEATAGVRQVALAAAEVSPTCARNPVSGIATMQYAHADGADAATSTTTLSFHPECDGTVDVIASIGVGVHGGLPLIGSSLPLDMTD